VNFQAREARDISEQGKLSQREEKREILNKTLREFASFCSGMMKDPSISTPRSGIFRINQLENFVGSDGEGVRMVEPNDLPHTVLLLFFLYFQRHPQRV